MNESVLKTIVVDGLAAYLGTGKSAAEIARDLRTPNVGDGISESNLRARVRNLIGSTPSEVAATLDSLISARGTDSTLAKSGALYSVVADE